MKCMFVVVYVLFEVLVVDVWLVWFVLVFEVIYFVFNEGYVVMVGDDWMCLVFCDEVLWFGCVLVGFVLDESEVFGFVVLMEL